MLSVQSILPVHGRATTNNHLQAYLLLLLGVVFLVVAKLGILNSYSLGELLFGLGMLATGLLKLNRLILAGWLTTLLGVASFLNFQHLIPGSQFLATHLLAIGLALLGCAWMYRHRYVDADIVTPALLILGVGVIEYLQAAHLTPPTFLPFALSLWLPGYGLLMLGLVCLATSARK
jgi:hypothetical protein